jgi:hypothetical protein
MRYKHTSDEQQCRIVTTVYPYVPYVHDADTFTNNAYATI